MYNCVSEGRSDNVIDSNVEIAATARLFRDEDRPAKLTRSKLGKLTTVNSANGVFSTQTPEHTPPESADTT